MRKAALFCVTFALLLVAGIITMDAAEAPVGPAAAISAPAHAAVITGDTATVTVLFDAGAGSKVSAAELYVDGELHDTVAVSPPMSSGTCKLTWRCGDFDKGKHTLTARVYDSTGHSRAVDVEVTLESAMAPGKAGERLRIEIMAPAEGQEISGTTQVRVTTDESHVRYVMLLIDDVFVALTNMPPFTYALNTTRYLNGPHALRATAFDLTDNPTDSPTIHVIINNPGGRTEMREQPGAATTPASPPAAAASPTPPAPLQTISEAPTVKPLPQARALSAPAPRPIGTAANASAPDIAAAGSDAAVGQSGNPSAPSMATPRAPVAPAPRTIAAPRLAPAIAKPSTAMAVKPDHAAATSSASVPFKPTSDARLTAAVASNSSPATSDEPAGTPSSPAVADERSSAPKQPVRIAMAPPAPATVQAPAEPGVATSAPEVQAATVSDDPAGATSKVAAASAISRLPKIAALPAAPRSVSSPVDAAPTSAPDGVQVAALAEVAHGSMIAPAPPITKAPRVAAPVQVARAPSAPAALSATVAERGEVIVHTVAPGEQLGSISAKYEIPASVIARLNGLSAETELAAGCVLRIPWKSALVLNGRPVYTDVPLASEGSITLAPFRAIVEHSGGAVHWIAANRQVRALAFSHDIRVTMGSRAAMVDSTEYVLETESKLVRERAMVPLGLFRDALGFKVTFEQSTGRIYLAAQ